MLNQYLFFDIRFEILLIKCLYRPHMLHPVINLNATITRAKELSASNIPACLYVASSTYQVSIDWMMFLFNIDLFFGLEES